MPAIDRRTLALCLTLLLLLLPLTAQAATFFASPSGSGSTCSTGSRCSLATGLTKLTAGGCHTLVLGNGTYPSRLTLDDIHSGTSNSCRTTIRAENFRGATLRPSLSSVQHVVNITKDAHHITLQDFVIDGTNTPDNTKLIKLNGDGPLSGANNIHLLGLEVKNSTLTSLIQMAGCCHTLRNLYMHHDNQSNRTEYGLYWQARDSILEDSYFANIPEYLIQVYHTGQNSNVTRNIIRRNVFNGPYSNIQGNSTGVTVYGEGNYIHNNVFYNALGNGIDVRNRNNVIKNNIIYAQGGAPIGNFGTSGTVIANNLCGTSDADCAIIGNPLFRDAANGQFDLRAGSPAINTGTASIASTYTLAGNGTPDIGAHETFTIQNCTITGTSLVCNLNPLRQPLRPNPCTVSDWQVTYAAAATPGTKVDQTENSCTASGTQVTITMAASPSSTARVELIQTPSSFPVTDGARIGGISTNGQRLNAQTVQVQNGTTGTPPPVNPVLTVGAGQVERVNTTGTSASQPPTTGNLVLHDATTTTQGTGTNPSLSHPTAADADLAIVSVVLASNTAQVNSGTAGGQALTLGTRAVHSGTSTLSSEVWSRTSPLTGSQTYSLTLSASTEYKVSVTTYRVVNTASPFTLGTNVTSGTGNVSTSIASSAGNLIHDVVGMTPGPGPEMAVSTEAGNTSTTMSWTASDSAVFRTHILVNIHQDPGPPPAPDPVLTVGTGQVERWNTTRTSVPPPPATGNVVLHDATTTTQGTGTNPTLVHPTAADADLVLVSLVLASNTVQVNSGTAGGQAMAIVGSRAVHSGTSTLSSEVWSRVSPPTGSQTYSLTLSGSTEYKLTVSTFRNVNTAAPFTAGTNVTSGTGNVSTAIASTPGNLVYDVVGMTPGPGPESAGSTEAGSTSTTMSWTSSSSTVFRTHILVNIQQDPGGPPPTVVEFDAVTTIAGSGLGPTTFSHTAAADATLAVGLLCIDNNSITVTEHTYGGAALTFKARAAHDVGGITCELWTLVNPPTGPQTVSVTKSAFDNHLFAVATFKGVNVANPIGTPVLVGTGSGDVSSVVSSTAGDLVFSLVGSSVTTATITAGPGESDRWNQQNGTLLEFAGFSTPGDTSVTTSATLSSAVSRVQIAFNIRQVTEGEEPLPVKTQRHYQFCEAHVAEGTFCQPEDASVFLVPGACSRLRMAVSVEVADAPAQGYVVYWRKNGVDPYVALDLDPADAFSLGDDRAKNFGDPVTCRMSFDTRTCVGGAWLVDEVGQHPPLLIPANGQGEWETVICAHKDLITGTDYGEFQMRNADGTALDAVTQLPRATMGAPFAFWR